MVYCTILIYLLIANTVLILWTIYYAIKLILNKCKTKTKFKKGQQLVL